MGQPDACALKKKFLTIFRYCRRRATSDGRPYSTHFDSYDNETQSE